MYTENCPCNKYPCKNGACKWPLQVPCRLSAGPLQALSRLLSSPPEEPLQAPSRFL